MSDQSEGNRKLVHPDKNRSLCSFLIASIATNERVSSRKSRRRGLVSDTHGACSFATSSRLEI